MVFSKNVPFLKDRSIFKVDFKELRTIEKKLAPIDLTFKKVGSG
jgi:hypothetical protein